MFATSGGSCPVDKDMKRLIVLREHDYVAVPGNNGRWLLARVVYRGAIQIYKGKRWFKLHEMEDQIKEVKWYESLEDLMEDIPSSMVYDQDRKQPVPAPVDPDEPPAPSGSGGEAPLGSIGPDPCPRCGSALVLRKGPHGSFWGCSTFPQCKGTAQYTRTQTPRLFPDGPTEQERLAAKLRDRKIAEQAAANVDRSEDDLPF